jgi:hypothetical protein
MKAYKTLVKKALSKDFTVSVWDGEEWQVSRSSKYQDIIDAIESVDFSELRIRNSNGEYLGWASIVLDCEPECMVADFTDNQIMNELAGFEWDGE